MNHDPRMLQIVHNVRLDGNDDIEMNQKKSYTFQARDGHHILFPHPYVRFTHILDMLPPKAHEPRPEDAPDRSQC